MPSERSFPDVAILTVIPDELNAARSTLGIEASSRERVGGSIYYHGTVESTLKHRSYSVVLGCIGDAGNAASASAAQEIINHFRPRAFFLMGIAAGVRDKIKIGDVVFAERVVAYEAGALVVNADGSRIAQPRPDIDRAPHNIWQDVVHYRLERKRVESLFTRLGGIFPKLQGEQQEHANYVASSINFQRSTIASGEKLLRDPGKLHEIRRDTHGKVEVGEMEAAGFVEACRRGNVPWLIVRGISDFGDELKDDRFHDFASRTAAAVLVDFVRHGLDLEYADAQGPISPSRMPVSHPVSFSIPVGGREASPQLSARVNEIASMIRTGTFPAKRVGQCEALELGDTCPILKLPDSFGRIPNRRAYLESLASLQLPTNMSPQDAYQRMCFLLELDEKYRNDPNIYLDSHIRALDSVCAAHPCDYAILRHYEDLGGKRPIRASADVLAVSNDGRFVYLLRRGKLSYEAENELNTFGGLIDPVRDRGSLRECAMREFREETGYSEGSLSVDYCPVLLQREEDFNVSTVVFLGVSVGRHLAYEGQEGHVFSIDLTKADEVYNALATSKWVDSGRQSLLTWFALGCPVQGQLLQTITKEYAEELFRRGLQATLRS